MESIERSPRRGFDLTMFDDAFPDEWSIEDRIEAIETVERESPTAGMFANIPRRCTKGCPDIANKHCRLPKRPYGERCPYEVRMLRHIIETHLASLDVDENDIVTIGLIRDLADCEMMIMRRQGAFAESPELLYEKPVYTKDGILAGHELAESPLVSIDDRFHKRKQQILKQLVATREQRAKLEAESVKRSEMMRVAEIMERAYRKGDDVVDVTEDAVVVDEFVDGAGGDDEGS